MERIRRRFRGTDPRDPQLPLRKRLLALEVNDVRRTVASHYEVGQGDFASRWGGRPRAIAAWLARRQTELSLRQLGSHFGLTHPSSVSNLTRRMDRERHDSAAVRKELALLEQRLLDA